MPKLTNLFPKYVKVTRSRDNSSRTFTRAFSSWVSLPQKLYSGLSSSSQSSNNDASNTRPITPDDNRLRYVSPSQRTPAGNRNTRPSYYFNIFGNNFSRNTGSGWFNDGIYFNQCNGYQSGVPFRKSPFIKGLKAVLDFVGKIVKYLVLSFFAVFFILGFLALMENLLLIAMNGLIEGAFFCAVMVFSFYTLQSLVGFLNKHIEYVPKDLQEGVIIIHQKLQDVSKFVEHKIKSMVLKLKSLFTKNFVNPNKEGSSGLNPAGSERFPIAEAVPVSREGLGSCHQSARGTTPVNSIDLTGGDIDLTGDHIDLTV